MDFLEPAMIDSDADDCVFVCCQCEPDEEMDSITPALIRCLCRKHGPSWHRAVFRVGENRFAAFPRRMLQ